MWMGRRRDFSLDELELLREAARSYMLENGIKQGPLAELMDMRQQNVSRFVATGSIAGISRISGNRLAQACGFRDAEELIAEGRAMAGLRAERRGNVWHARDSARRVAEAMGYSAESIRSVVEREADNAAAAKRPAKWWLTQIALEELRHS